MNPEDIDYRAPSDYIDIGNHSGPGFDPRFWNDKLLPAAHSWIKYSHVRRVELGYNSANREYTVDLSLTGGGATVMRLAPKGREIMGRVITGIPKQGTALSSELTLPDPKHVTFTLLTSYVKKLGEACKQ